MTEMTAVRERTDERAAVVGRESRTQRSKAPAMMVDTDIHPAALPRDIAPRLAGRFRERYETYGVRVPGPPAIYPRVSNGGFRRDSWPVGGFPGSDLPMMQEQLLDEFGIDYGILIPLNGQGWGAEEPEYAAALCRAVNEWIVEEWLDKEPRLRSTLSVPLETPELAVREIEYWANDPRFVQVLLSTGGETGFGRRKYWPIYAAAEAAGLPLAAHTGGLEQHRGAGWPSFYLEEHVWNGNTMAGLVMSFLCEGAFEKFPSLQVLCVEGGISWAGPLMWTMDSAWQRMRSDVPHLKHLPSEYIREHFWFTTQPVEEPDDPADLGTAFDHMGMNDRILFASDYPHWDFDSPRMAPRQFPADARGAIMGDNACRLYGFTR